MSTLSLSDYLDPHRLDDWLAALGIPAAPTRREGVRTALQFFAAQMPTLPAHEALSFLLAMDLSRRVRIVLLAEETKVAAFRLPDEPLHKLFYSKVGSDKHDLGINPADRQFVRFEVVYTAAALESYTTGAIDTWTRPLPGQKLVVAPRGKPNTKGYLARGGAIQYIIPNASRYLKVLPPPDKEKKD